MPASVLLLAAASLLLPPRPRSLGLFGVCAFGLGIASLAPEMGALLSAPAGFVRVSAGFLLLGLILEAVGGLATLVDASRPRERWIGVLPLGATAAVIWSVTPVFVAAGTLPTVLAAAGVLAVALALALAGAVVRPGRLPRWLDARWLSPTRTPARGPMTPPQMALLGAGVLGALVALAVPHLLAITLGAMVVAATAHLYGRFRGSLGRFPMLPILCLALLFVVWLVATIAGPLGLGLAALREAPFSEAAEILLIPPLVAAAWGFLGLWPVHGAVPGPILAPIAGVLLVRLGNGLLPNGMAHWEPAIALAAVLAGCHAVATKRWTELFCAAALLGAACSAPPAAVWALLASATAVSALQIPWVEARMRVMPPRLASMWWLLPVWAGVETLQVTLRAQAVYSVVLAGLVAAGTWEAGRE